MKRVFKVSEEIYADFYSRRNIQDADDRGCCAEELYVRPVTIETEQKALQEMQRGKAGGKDRVSVHLVKEGGYINLDKLGNLHSESLKTLRVSEAHKNYNVILIHKERDLNELKNYASITAVEEASVC